MTWAPAGRRALFLPRAGSSLSVADVRRWYENIAIEIADPDLPVQVRARLQGYYRRAGLLRASKRRFFHHHYARTLALACTAMFQGRGGPLRVLDLGSGLGTQSLLFALLGGRVMSVDVRPEAVSTLRARQGLYERAAGRPLALSINEANALEFDYAVAQFDGVYSLFAFNLIQPSSRLLDALCRGLASEAVLVIQDGNREMWLNRLFRRRPVLSTAALHAELRARGFSGIRCNAGYALPPVGWWLLPHAVAKAIDAWLARYPILVGSYLHIARYEPGRSKASPEAQEPKENSQNISQASTGGIKGP